MICRVVPHTHTHTPIHKRQTAFPLDSRDVEKLKTANYFVLGRLVLCGDRNENLFSLVELYQNSIR